MVHVVNQIQHKTLHAQPDLSGPYLSLVTRQLLIAKATYKSQNHGLESITSGQKL